MLPGTFDTATNTIWWGTANPAPFYDWSGPDHKTSGARPGKQRETNIKHWPRAWKIRLIHQDNPGCREEGTSPARAPALLPERSSKP